MTIAQYVADMANYKLLSREEESQLTVRIYSLMREFQFLIMSHPLTKAFILERWNKIKSENKSSSKLSEMFGTGEVDAKELSSQVEKSMLALEAATETEDIVSTLKESDLASHLYFDIIRTLEANNDRDVPLIRKVYNEFITARNELVVANLRLVVTFAKSFHGFGIPLTDLIQEGNIALIRAVEKFDPKKNLKFSTYAAYWIKSAFVRYIRNRSKMIRIPYHIYDKVTQIQKAKRDVAKTEDHEASIREISQSTNLPAEDIEQIVDLFLEPISLESEFKSEPKAKDEIKSIKDVIADHRDFEELISRDITVDAMENEMVLLLTLEEQEIMELKFGLGNQGPCSLNEISKRTGRSRENIKQLESSAMSKLRNSRIFQEARNLYT